jgi:hypothetical protein
MPKKRQSSGIPHLSEPLIAAKNTLFILINHAPKHGKAEVEAQVEPKSNGALLVCLVRGGKGEMNVRLGGAEDAANMRYTGPLASFDRMTSWIRCWLSVGTRRNSMPNSCSFAQRTMATST